MAGDASRVWIPDLVQRISGFLHPNVVAGTLRLVDKATAALLHSPQNTSIRLSQPVPEHAFARQWAGPQGSLRTLSRAQRVDLLSLTACSGSIANLEILGAETQYFPHLGAAAFAAAASAGHLHVCRWLLAHGCRGDHTALLAAARGKHEALCEWLLEQGFYRCSLLEGFVIAAARAGLQSLAEWAVKSRGLSHPAAAEAAACGGHADLADRMFALYLYGRKPSVNECCALLSGVAYGCDLPTLLRLYGKYGSGLAATGEGDMPGDAADRCRRLLGRAAVSPTPDWQAKVEWLEARGGPRLRDSSGGFHFQSSAPLERLLWLRLRGYPVTDYIANAIENSSDAVALQALVNAGFTLDPLLSCFAISGAVFEGRDLRVLRLLFALGAPVDATSLRHAAIKGLLPVVAWMVEEAGAATSVQLLQTAADSGSVELVAWLVDRGCPWDASVTAWAARCGHLPVMRLLHERGCPWDEEAFAAAAFGGNEEALEWLAERGCPMGTSGLPYAVAALTGDLSTLACLRRLGCPWSDTGETFTHAVCPTAYKLYGTGEEHHTGLSWLLDAGCPVDWPAALLAAQGYEDTSLVVWLRATRRQRRQDQRRQRRRRRLEERQQQQLALGSLEAPPGTLQAATPGAEANATGDGSAGQGAAPPPDTISRAHLIWVPELVVRIAGSAHPNEVACTLRLVDRATAALLRGPHHTTVRLSQPVPEHAFARHWGSPHGAMRRLTREQRQELLALTARSGSVPNLDLLLTRLGEDRRVLGRRAFAAAASAGQLHVCRWLHAQGCKGHHSALLQAARGKHGALCEWLLCNGYYRRKHAASFLQAAAEAGLRSACEWVLTKGRFRGELPYKAAARSGNVDLMEYFGRSRREAPCKPLLSGAAYGCDLLTLQRLYGSSAGLLGGDDGAPVAAAVAEFKKELLAVAAASPTPDWRAKVDWLLERGCQPGALQHGVPGPEGEQERLRWLQQRGFAVSERLMCCVVAANDVPALQALMDEGCVQLPVPDHNLPLRFPSLLKGLAATGGLSMLQFLHLRGWRFGPVEVCTAAENGHLPVVAWVVEEALGADGSKVLTVELFRAAAKSGSIELAAWLRDRGCPMDASVCAEAARSGRLDLLAWLREAGCPWDEATFADAAWAGSEEQLEWLAERGCPMGDDGLPYAAAAVTGDLSTLACLRRLGCPWSDTGETFAHAVDPQAYAYDRDGHGSSIPARVAGLAWLLEAGCPVNWREASAAASWVCEDGCRLRAWLRSQRRQRWRGRWQSLQTC